MRKNPFQDYQKKPNILGLIQNREKYMNNYKIALCENYKKYGRCKYGEKCLFAHGESDLRKKGSIFENNLHFVVSNKSYCFNFIGNKPLILKNDINKCDKDIIINNLNKIITELKDTNSSNGCLYGNLNIKPVVSNVSVNSGDNSSQVIPNNKEHL